MFVLFTAKPCSARFLFCTTFCFTWNKQLPSSPLCFVFYYSSFLDFRLEGGSLCSRCRYICWWLGFIPPGEIPPGPACLSVGWLLSNWLVFGGPGGLLVFPVLGPYLQTYWSSLGFLHSFGKASPPTAFWEKFYARKMFWEYIHATVRYSTHPFDWHRGWRFLTLRLGGRGPYFLPYRALI